MRINVDVLLYNYEEEKLRVKNKFSIKSSWKKLWLLTENQGVTHGENIQKNTKLHMTLF